MPRQVVRYEMAMLADGAQPVAPERVTLRAGEQRRAFCVEQLPGAGPVDQAHPRFESARPVRAQRVWTLLEPGREKSARALGIASLVRQVPRLRQGHQLQVTVQLPEILDIADDALVPVIDRLAVSEGDLDAGPGIAVPARRETEDVVAQQKYLPAAGEDAFGSFDVPVSLKPHRHYRSPLPPAAARSRIDLGL